MSRIPLVAIPLALMPLLFFSTQAVQSQAARERWEYLRLSPGLAPRSDAAFPSGYRACRAEKAAWNCTEFEGDGALHHALATLGDQGWEMVSVVDETRQLSYPKGSTYLFKRPQQH